MSLVVKAYAKINLLLDVLGKRSDGYHQVEMVMQTITLHDRLEFAAGKDVFLEIKGANLPAGDDNLIIRAARVVRDYTGCRQGARIILHKNIPVAAGLGGGSADAAAALIGLNQLWQLGLSKKELYILSEKIGSDVPFCISGGTALVEGRGEKLTNLPPAPAMGLVLIKPPYGISTAQVYHNLNLKEVNNHPNISKMIAAIERQDLLAVCKSMGNVLEEVAARMHPNILEIKRILLKQGALGALMSGSGSTVFAITEDLSSAKGLADRLLPEIGNVYIAAPQRAREGLQ
ncbi:4-(cytidine 5'-diphospho)-2-C-methyl-D-erythritol kinase [Desulfolucanica intricata]|uniref:4-(cytidine 5'-diphospho)-2-C-methyl-D-erythritol kinase n=1 Tax=Desulfolucanica intricata TaxID=1285191 RepID=UPI0008373F65|nr:4-(cytidine 5'-diphospho)-2-C-methyl-D-erythritol kinase [Desulfolucanica intricata]